MLETAMGIQRVKQKRQRLIIEVIAIVVICLIFVFVMPAILADFRLKLLGRFLSLAIVALGIDLIWGYTGLLSLGHGIFFSLGGYAFAMYLKLQLPEGEVPEFFTLYSVSDVEKVIRDIIWQPFHSFPLTLIAIIIVPGIIAGILGYLVFRNRIKGVYFSILTQAALLVFYNFFNGQQKFINGTNGLKTDTEKIFGFLVGSDQTQLVFYELTVLFVLLMYLLCRWLTSGRFGRLLIAIRDDESRVRFSGYDPTGFKMLVFGISGGIAGIAGALYTVQSGIVTPSFMEVGFSIEMVIWVAIGGRGTLVGAILGTLLANYGQSLLSEKFPDYWLYFQGALFLLVVTILPDGIVGWFKNWLIDVKVLLGISPQLITYPTIELDPEIQKEREEIDNKSY
jgi:urea transport system permease protein